MLLAFSIFIACYKHINTFLYCQYTVVGHSSTLRHTNGPIRKPTNYTLLLNYSFDLKWWFVGIPLYNLADLSHYEGNHAYASSVQQVSYTNNGVDSQQFRYLATYCSHVNISPCSGSTPDSVTGCLSDVSAPVFWDVQKQHKMVNMAVLN